MRFEKLVRQQHPELIPHFEKAVSEGYKLSHLSIELLQSYAVADEHNSLVEVVPHAESNGYSITDISIPLLKQYIQTTSSIQYYRITHFYDRGLKPVFIQGFSNPLRAAVFCEYIAEQLYGDEKQVSTEGIAAALIQFYGFGASPARAGAVEIEMHSGCASFCGEAYQELMADVTLHRPGLVEFLLPFLEG